MRVLRNRILSTTTTFAKKGWRGEHSSDRGEHSSLPGSPFIVRSGADALRSHPVGLAPPRGPRPCAAAALPRPLSRGLPPRALLRRPTWRRVVLLPRRLPRGSVPLGPRPTCRQAPMIMLLRQLQSKATKLRLCSASTPSCTATTQRCSTCCLVSKTRIS